MIQSIRKKAIIPRSKVSFLQYKPSSSGGSIVKGGGTDIDADDNIVEYIRKMRKEPSYLARYNDFQQNMPFYNAVLGV